MQMKWSDLLQEHYRKLSKSELERTRSFLQCNYSSYSTFSECENEEEVYSIIEDQLDCEDMAYAWASRLGTLSMRECDERVRLGLSV